jgi:LAGLIDADG-like domain
MERHELAWAAGFFDGEGWAAKNKTRGIQARINQSDNDGVPAVLVRFQRIVGRGRIHGPIREEGRQDLYYWDVSSREDVDAVANAIWPWLGEVKRTEFLAALSTAPISTQQAPSHTELLAWAGGLYDGEGSASVSRHRTQVGHFSPEVAVTQSGTERPQVLERLRDIVGCGRIYGPYAQEGATMPVFRWKAAAHSDVQHSLYLLSPWIGPVKRDQACQVLRLLVEQGRLPRGNAAWGNRKTHCLRGHEYATARIRPYVARRGGAQRRDSEQCLVCVRDDARERYRRRKGTRAADPDR